MSLSPVRRCHVLPWGASDHVSAWPDRRTSRGTLILRSTRRASRIPYFATVSKHLPHRCCPCCGPNAWFIIGRGPTVGSGAECETGFDYSSGSLGTRPQTTQLAPDGSLPSRKVSTRKPTCSSTVLMSTPKSVNGNISSPTAPDPAVLESTSSRLELPGCGSPGNPVIRGTRSCATLKESLFGLGRERQRMRRWTSVQTVTPPALKLGFPRSSAKSPWSA
jgi:hypothetical protein